MRQTREVDQPERAHAALRVECAGWSWRYAGRSGWALRDVSITIEPGERVLLLGASGSGKSTLLQAIAGVLDDAECGESAGSIHLSTRMRDATEPQVGMVLQDPDAQVLMARVGDDVAFGCENLGVAPADIRNRVDVALRSVALNLPRSTTTSTLSGGQQQRLALAGVVAMRPGLLLLDEPTAMLDPQGIRDLQAAVAELIEDRSTTLILVEHRVAGWLDLIDRVVVLGPHGNVLIDGHPTQVFEQERELLSEMGVWVPSIAPLRRQRHGGGAQQTLLATRDLKTGWRADLPGTSVPALELRAGRIVAVTGPNGVGKSTLALTLAGLLPPVSGSVDAEPIADGLGSDPISWSSRQLGGRIGMVFQSPDHEFVRHTVEDELGVGLQYADLDEASRRDRVAELAEQLGLAHLLQANPFTLSGGEKRRLSVACALAAKPRVLILDEPTFGQDARTWSALVDLFVALRDEGCAILIVTHDALLVETLADDRFELTETAVADRASSALTEPPRSRLDAINPLAKIGAAAVISLALILSLDWVSATVALALELIAVLASGLTARRVLRLTAPLLIAAALTAVTIALYGRTSGTVYVEFLLVRVSNGSLELALATFLRVLAMALPAVVLLTTIRPTDLADALEQHTSLPPKFILGALVALRQLDTLTRDWQTLERSRRARGVGDGWALKRFWSQAFGLFVLAIRRADVLSVAMLARGFTSNASRTWTRTSRWRVADWLFLIGALVVIAVAIGVAVAAGAWSLVFGGVAA